MSESKKIGIKEIILSVIVVTTGLYFLGTQGEQAAPISGEQAAPNSIEFTEAGIKSLDPDIISVNIDKQAMPNNPKSYAVELEIKRDPSNANNEWNYISQTYIHRIGSRLLDMQQVSRLRMVFISPSDGNKQWAQVKISKKDFSGNWKELTYHQFFSRTDPDANTLQIKSWLCRYYSKYESSRPNGTVPLWCERFSDGRFD